MFPFNESSLYKTWRNRIVLKTKKGNVNNTTLFKLQWELLRKKVVSWLVNVYNLYIQYLKFMLNIVLQTICFFYIWKNSNTINVTMRITMRAHLICFYSACIVCLEFMKWFSCELTEQLWCMHIVSLPTKCSIAANGPKMLKLWLLLGITPVNASIHKACLSRTFLQQSAELCPCWRGFPYFQQLII